MCQHPDSAYTYRTQIMPVTARAAFCETESLSAGRAKSPRPATTRPHFIMGAQKNTSADVSHSPGMRGTLSHAQPNQLHTSFRTSRVVHKRAEAAAETCGRHGDGGPIDGRDRSVRRGRAARILGIYACIDPGRSQPCPSCETRTSVARGTRTHARRGRPHRR